MKPIAAKLVSFSCAFSLLALVGCDRWRHEYGRPEKSPPNIKYSFQFPEGTSGNDAGRPDPKPMGPAPSVYGGNAVRGN
jgi:hypothetical protein